MTRPRALAFTLAAAVLGACTLPDSVVERGAPPPIEASLLTQEAWLRLHGHRLPGGERDALERAVRLVTLGRPEAVRAAVTARAPEADAVRQALIGLGLDPVRIELVGAGHAQPGIAPGIAYVSLSRFVLHSGDCGDAIQPSTDPGIDVSTSLDSLGRCVQANNLAQMLADPGDLLASPPLAPQPGVVASGAIVRMRGQLGLSPVLSGANGAGPAPVAVPGAGVGAGAGAGLGSLGGPP